MLKVIIIDDESLTREGLIKYVDWHKFGFSVFGQAADGKEGLELAKQVQPELAICDIRMPHMNGIEMVENLQDVAPHCKIIFLSGYSDKEYLRSAIKLNVLGYLEKPVDMQELGILLTKMRNEHTETLGEINQKNKLSAKLQESNQFLLDSILLQFASGEEHEAKTLDLLLKNMNIEFPLTSVYRMVVIKGSKDNQSQVLLNELIKFKRSSNLSMLIGIDKDEVLIIHAYKINHRKLQTFYNNLFEKLETEYDLQLEIGIGKTVSDLNDLHYSYREALDAIEWEGYKNINRAVHLSDNENNITVVRDVERYIAENYEESITIKDIANVVYLTPQYLCKVFKTATGVTINSYITDLRMEKSIALVLNRDLKIYEVSAQLGYSDPNYFARIFRKYHNMNPSEYREIHKV